MNLTLQNKTLLFMSIAIIFGLFTPTSTDAHCQIPCGIYDDYSRVTSMLEHTETIAKSVRLINELSSNKDAQSQNQLTRWVMNKEKHAQKIIDVICNYFLTQRVKTDTNDYSRRLIKHHAVIIAAMKVKQNTDQKYVDDLKQCILKLAPYYKEHNH